MKEQPEASVSLKIKKATQNNLKGISLEIPLQQLVVLTGRSGSGKSSLGFEVIAKEGQRRFMETLPGFSRQYLAKLAPAKVEKITGLPPVIALSQHSGFAGDRSTVGTHTGIYDSLRLLFARCGTTPEGKKLTRSHFSFNQKEGACPECQGLGITERISVDKLVADPAKSLREGALAPTLPNGYIMYSQVTVDVLNRVCEAHGFSVEIPWNQLSGEQQNVILNGSDRLKVPFGKHSLESRLKWTGIAAKPREEGFYKGMLPIMSDILRRDRNKNILKYAEAVTCETCHGKRLSREAISVKFAEKSIDQWTAFQLPRMKSELQKSLENDPASPVLEKVVPGMIRKLDRLIALGLEHFSLDEPASRMSQGEAQRARLVNQLTAPLSRVLYIFDEPSIGLHPQHHQALLNLFRELVDGGNTVVVIEHDLATVKMADWIVEMGPGAGSEGGEVLFNGPLSRFLSEGNLNFPTFQAMQKVNQESGFSYFYLPETDWRKMEWESGTLNLITSTPDARLRGQAETWIQSDQEKKGKITFLDQKPIGKTPRSNPATYTGLADKLRDLFAKQDLAKELGFKKSRFSFNTKGGRCETCQGAGRIQVGMHLMGKVEVPCETCRGARFNPETLRVKVEGMNIAEILNLTVREAKTFFANHPKILPFLDVLVDMGLDYITLGQPSTTLSGGEAQRIRLATHLLKSKDSTEIIVLEAPSVGLHALDLRQMAGGLREYCLKKRTFLILDHDPVLAESADKVICVDKNGLLLEKPEWKPAGSPGIPAAQKLSQEIRFSGVKTHLLKGFDISFPYGKLIAVAGPSGSGKSSLVFDTLYAEAQTRFAETFSTLARNSLKINNPADFSGVQGLTPVVPVGRKFFRPGSRSTVGTECGLQTLLRLLFSRFAQLSGETLTASHFSFNQTAGACPDCGGLGHKLTCDPEKLISHPAQTLDENPMQGHRAGRFYGDPFGRYVALLRAAAKAENLSLEGPWEDWTSEAQKVALWGTGEREYAIDWHFKNKTRSGVQHIQATFDGFCNYVDEEYARKHHNKNIAWLADLMHPQTCKTCRGGRLAEPQNSFKIKGMTLADWNALSLSSFLQEWKSFAPGSPMEKAIWSRVGDRLLKLIQLLLDLELGHLSAGRGTASLSGGEAQRLQLAAQFSHPLSGVTYVLDEPTMGLDGGLTQKLIHRLRMLVGEGNTVVVVEHDPEVLMAADLLLEMGPGAGKEGGDLVYEGAPEGVRKADTLTGKALQNTLEKFPDSLWNPYGIKIKGAFRHNLKNIDLDIGRGGLIVITGPSGSGKSSLMEGVLFESWARKKAVGCMKIEGWETWDAVELLEQRLPPRNRQSSVAGFSGLLDLFQVEFSKTEEAKKLGLKKRNFSYGDKTGRCPACEGTGRDKLNLDFVGHFSQPCETCGGKRFSAKIQAVTWQGNSLPNWLNLPIAEIRTKLEKHSKIKIICELLSDLGLGHLPANQSLADLSTGENQRLQLAQKLLKKGRKKQLFLLDEPTTGLHLHDVDRLLKLFKKLILEEHTLIVVEHHPRVLTAANQVIRLGPVGGPEGGFLLSE